VADLPFQIIVRDNGSVVVRRFGQGVEGASRTTQRSARRMTRAFRGVGRGIRRLPGLIFNVRNALIGLGGALVIRSIVGAGDVVERARARLIGLRGGIEGANRAFDFFQRVAGKVAFSLEDVIEAGVALEAFGARSEDTLEAVTDLAGFMGVRVPEAAAAFGRAFAGGAGAADILRERGVLTLVSLRTGIDDLTKLSLPEFRKALLTAMVDPTGPIANAAQRLAETWQGVVSFLSDAFFRLRQQLFEAGVGDLLKDIVRTLTTLLNSLVDAVSENRDAIRTFFDGLRSLLPTANDLVNRFENLAQFFVSILPQALLKTNIFFIKTFRDIAAFVTPFINSIVNAFLVGFARILDAVAETARGFARLVLQTGPILSKFLGVTLDQTLDLARGLVDVSGAIKRVGRSLVESTEGPSLLDEAVGGLNLALSGTETILGKVEGRAKSLSDFFIQLRASILRIETGATDAGVALIKLDPIFTRLRTGLAVQAVFAPFRDLTPESIDQINTLLDMVTERQQERILEDLNRAELAKEKRVEFVQDEVSRILSIRQVLRDGSVRLLGAIAQFAETQGEKSFKIAQAFQIAEAITAGILAVQRALASPPGPPFTIPLAAAIAIQTAANVQRIRSTRPGGGAGIAAPSGGGGVPGGGAPGAVGAPVEVAAAAGPNITVIVEGGLIGDQSEAAMRIADLVREALGDGGQIEVIA
jgi:hypothetical protein